MTTFEVEATEDEEESVEMKFSADGTFLSKDADDDDDDKEEKE